MEDNKITLELKGRLKTAMYLYWTKKLLEQKIITEEEYSKLVVHFKLEEEYGRDNKNQRKK